jgi:heterodisulfide reductase subunit C
MRIKNMTQWQISHRVVYEADLNPDFSEQIQNTPGGEHLSSCIQCGTCSATCPLSIYMDYTPRRLIAMTRAGFEEEVLKSFTIWLCASCYSCSVECPKQIKITDVMYALKRNAIQKKVYPRKFPVPVLAKEFFNLIKSNGRNNERALILRLYLKTNMFKMLKQASIGWRLFSRGRMELGSEKTKNRKQLRTLMDAMGGEVS